MSKTSSNTLQDEQKMTDEKKYQTLDANEAVAYVAYRLNEVIAIYPITPSSAMGEWADEWASQGKKNLWGVVPSVIEMQSEGGAVGAVHGALQAGTLATTFTASQGLLLMLPNMYKIAGELTPAVFHVAARSLAAQALSIFGDHSDVMSARMTGFAFLCSCSVQEAMDFALIAQAASLKSRIPFVHFFDGFRTSHEVSKIEMVSESVMRSMIDEETILRHRLRRLTPDNPVLRGTSQNPDVYFQARESVNSFYLECPKLIQQEMDRFAKLTGRQYHLYDYYGDPAAERVIVIMGSGAEAVSESVDYLNSKGEKVGVLKVRLFRPFDSAAFVAALPSSVKSIAVLDRTKEPGSLGEPLYLDCVTSIHENRTYFKHNAIPKIIGGRYGLSSKEFTPAMISSIFEHLLEDEQKTHFTIGIDDDVTNSSLPFDPGFSIEPKEVIRALFYGLGSDGTVGANKNSIKIIGENTPYYVQGYFVYDSKKAGAITVSHLRFGPNPIRSSYLITSANFVACHQPYFLERYDMLQHAAHGATFLLNTSFAADEVWNHLPRQVQEHVIGKKLKLFVIDAYKIACESKMGGRINTVMQVCFFAISGVLPKEQAIGAIKDSIKKTYGKKGDEVVKQNLDAVDHALANLFQVTIPSKVTSTIELVPPVSAEASPFARDVLGKMITGDGDYLPVSALPCDGTYPTGTSKLEKRNLAQEIPVWEPGICIQCGKCAMVCPHAVIRIKVYEPDCLAGAPSTFKTKDATDLEWKGLKYTIQVAPEDCTGCSLCVDVCPAKSKTEPDLKALHMKPQPALKDEEKKNWDFFLDLPELDRRKIKSNAIRQQQVQEPLFEFSSACTGCGETPYIKLMSQLFGDRAVIANATGCSSIYGGNLPTTPWTKNKSGRGPAWCNSLFEDNAEFGLGIRISLDQQIEIASMLLKKHASEIGTSLVDEILKAHQKNEADIFEQRQRVATLKQKLSEDRFPEAKQLSILSDIFVKKTVWIVGGDGWAYDIGFGGLDHVLASGKNVNVLVLDTEVYSNTGGQMSKSTPRAAVAKFAMSGKPTGKKDLGLIAMTYGNVYVAHIAMGAKDEHTLRSFLEAEAYDGPSLIIAYSHCIAHGINMATALKNQKMMVDSGQWPLYRFNPDRLGQGENPFQLDSAAPKIPAESILYLENRFKMLTKSHPEKAKLLLEQAQQEINSKRHFYEFLSGYKFPSTKEKS